MERLSYEEIEKEMISEISKLGKEGIAQRGVLSTSHNDIVTSRRMRFIPDGLKLYGWTTKNARKHKQIESNPKVSVCVGFVQIDGTAFMMKHPMDEPEFLKLYKAKMPVAYSNSVKDWRDYDQAIIEVIPKRIALYHPIGRPDVSYLDVLYTASKEAYRFYGLNEIEETNSDIKFYWG